MRDENGELKFKIQRTKNKFNNSKFKEIPSTVFSAGSTTVSE